MSQYWNSTTIDFNRLRQVNLSRCIQVFNHQLDQWSVAEWGAATIGEGGEACNVAKKLLRVRDGFAYMNNMSVEELKKALADEIADMVIYADLWAASQGIDLGEAVRDKFNRDSVKHGVPEFKL